MLFRSLVMVHFERRRVEERVCVYGGKPDTMIYHLGTLITREALIMRPGGLDCVCVTGILRCVFRVSRVGHR